MADNHGKREQLEPEHRVSCSGCGAFKGAGDCPGSITGHNFMRDPWLGPRQVEELDRRDAEKKP